MKSRLSITLALFAVAGTGWLLVSGLTPNQHTVDPNGGPPVASQTGHLPVTDANENRMSIRDKSCTIRVPGLHDQPTRKSADASPLHQTARINQARQGANAPQLLRPSSLSVSTDSVKSQDPEIASADRNRVSVPENGPEDQDASAPVAPQPAVWVDLGEDSSLSQDQLDEIQNLAESLSRKITESGFDPASPEYRQVWEEAVKDSDRLFRQRYGDRAWMDHHIQAYHLAYSTGK